MKTNKIGLIISTVAVVMILIKLVGIVNYGWLIATVLIWLPICIWLLWLIVMGVMWSYYYIKNWLL